MDAFRFQCSHLPQGESQTDINGWVYFAGAYEGFSLIYVKIGFTARLPVNRVDQLRATVPYDVKLLAAVGGCRTLELAYLREFSDTHARGEWFRPSQSILTRIEALNAMTAPWPAKRKPLRRR